MINYYYRKDMPFPSSLVKNVIKPPRGICAMQHCPGKAARFCCSKSDNLQKQSPVQLSRDLGMPGDV